MCAWRLKASGDGAGEGYSSRPEKERSEKCLMALFWNSFIFGRRVLRKLRMLRFFYSVLSEEMAFYNYVMVSIHLTGSLFLISWSFWTICLLFWACLS